jgi:hypothetical protein
MARIALEHDIFTERGIAPEVAEARGYRRYETPEDVYAVDSRWQAFPGHLKQWCAGSPGWVMPKFRVPGSSWGDPLAQLRPDKALRDRTYGHDHDGMTHVAQDCPCGVRKHSERTLARQPQEPLGSYERELVPTTKIALRANFLRTICFSNQIEEYPSMQRSRSPSG